jgi:aspartyl-tRNA(Asn)/glutamyl-tRNA(Gln) amidotransferase subunit B
MTSALEEYLSKYEPVIGLEVHAQLKTKTKLFCSCKTEFGSEANTNVCPVCLAMPGVLPVLNQEALNLAMKASLALGCTVQEVSKFDRKQYFYPDLPKGYQISQFNEPIALNGKLALPDGSTVRITRLHMEEDAGKLVHAGAERLHGSSYSLADMNRAGTPLAEIVSEPDIRTAEQAKLYVQELRLILIYCGVCDGNLEEGSMRCDINISLRKIGTEKFGTRAEIKNVNSFRSIVRAIEHEIERQGELLDSGEKVVQETRLWDENTGTTASMRSKEEANDYRYFPEPDLLPVLVSKQQIKTIEDTLPMLPSGKRSKYSQEFALNDEEVYIFVEDIERGQFFDKCVEQGAIPKKAASWINGPIAAGLKEREQTFLESKFNPGKLAQVLGLIEKGIISDSSARKDLLNDLFDTDEDPETICEKKGLKQINDEGAIAEGVKAILDEFPDQLAELRSGKDKMKAFFVGQAMKKFKGKASPGLVNQILDDLVKA